MIILSSQELTLYQQCVNEVLRGFHAEHMERTVGVSYAILMKEDAALYHLRKSSAQSSEIEMSIPVRPLVIEEAIRQLGIDEFETRTGFSLEDGDRFLEKARKAV